MDFLFKKRDSKQLALLRIIIGLWLFVDMVSILVSGYLQKAYIDPIMHFPFYGFEWIKPLPGPAMYILFFALTGASVLITLGYKMREAILFFIIGYGYVFMCDIVYTLNKFYLLLILVFVLLFTQADRYWSYRVKKRPKEKKTHVAAWQILTFQVLIGIVYTYSGIAKINPDWILNAQPLSTFYRNKILFRSLENNTFSAVAYTISYLGLLFDLGIIWLLWYRKTNWLANIAQAIFHTLNFFILGIGSLSLFSIFLTWLLFPTTWLKKKIELKKFKGLIENPSTTKKRMISIALSIFILVNLLIPHRHFITGNNVNWTEKGHRFSWRLMSRSKRGSYASFYVTDRKTGNVTFENPKKYLTSRQYRKMCGETDLVIVFAHFLEELYIEKGISDVVVNARVMTRMNSRPAQLLVDPTLDLSKVERSFLKDNISNPPPITYFNKKTIR